MPSARSSSPLPSRSVPEFPPGTRFLVWAGDGDRVGVNTTHLAITPYEPLPYRAGFFLYHAARELTNLDNINDALQAEEWWEVSETGFQAMMRGFLDRVEYSEFFNLHRITNGGPITLKPRPGSTNLGSPKGVLP
jgi:hypothetical protein